MFYAVASRKHLPEAFGWHNQKLQSPRPDFCQLEPRRKSDGMQEPRADGYTLLKRLIKIRAGRHMGMFTGVRWCSLTFVFLAHTFIAHFFPCNLELNWFQGDFPHFNSLTEVETRAAFGNLHGLFKTVRLNEKEAGNCFLGFRKRAVRHHVLARENLTRM